MTPPENQPVAESKVRRITPDCPPVFPCWLWRPSWNEWCKYAPGGYLAHDCTHHHPDAPTAPTEKPPFACDGSPVVGSPTFATTIEKARGRQGPPDKPTLFAEPASRAEGRTGGLLAEMTDHYNQKEDEAMTTQPTPDPQSIASIAKEITALETARLTKQLAPDPDPTPSDIAAAREINLRAQEREDALPDGWLAAILARHTAPERQERAMRESLHQDRIEGIGIVLTNDMPEPHKNPYKPESIESSIYQLRSDLARAVQENEGLRGLVARKDEALRTAQSALEYAPMHASGDILKNAWQVAHTAVALTPASYSDALAEARKEIERLESICADHASAMSSAGLWMAQNGRTGDIRPGAIIHELQAALAESRREREHWQQRYCLITESYATLRAHSESARRDSERLKEITRRQYWAMREGDNIVRHIRTTLFPGWTNLSDRDVNECLRAYETEHGITPNYAIDAAQKGGAS